MKDIPHKIANSDAASAVTAVTIGAVGGASLLAEVQSIFSIIASAMAILIGYYTLREHMAKRRSRAKKVHKDDAD